MAEVRNQPRSPKHEPQGFFHPLHFSAAGSSTWKSSGSQNKQGRCLQSAQFVLSPSRRVLCTVLRLLSPLLVSPIASQLTSPSLAWMFCPSHMMAKTNSTRDLGWFQGTGSLVTQDLPQNRLEAIFTHFLNYISYKCDPLVTCSKYPQISY